MRTSLFGNAILTSLIAITCIDHSLHSSSRTMSIDVRHSEGGGVGYSQSYSSLDGFFSVDKETYLPYLDARGHVFNDGRFAANLGLGTRGVFESSCLAVGGNIFYDFRQTHHHNYNQIGLGLEVLMPLWSVHVNGYFPVGSKKSHFFQKSVRDVSLGSSGGGGAGGDPVFDHFAGHNLFLLIPGISSSSFVRIKKKKKEFAMTGVEADVNVHVVKVKNVLFEAGAGPYYYRGSYGKQAIGGKAKVTAKWSKYVAGEFAASYDNLFHARVHGGIALIYPFGPKIPKKRENNPKVCTSNPDFFYDRLVRRADRAEIIVVDRKKFVEKETFIFEGTAGGIQVAINPATGLPWNFIFVNNQSSSDGTFESPYPTLALAEANSGPGDIIYVYPGDGTTMGYNTGLTMQDVQKLWGAGIDQSLITQLGAIVVPAQAGSNPNISNGMTSGFMGEAVILANNNEISGCNLFDELGFGFLVNGNNIINLTFKNNSIQPPVGGAGILINSTDLGTVNLSDNTFQIVDFSGGVSFTGSAEVIAERNTFEGTGMAGTGMSIFGSSNNVISLQVTDNSFANLSQSGSPTGVLLFPENNCSSTAVLSNNMATESGFLISASDTSTTSVDIGENQFNSMNNLAVNVNNSDTSNIDLTVHQNTFIGGGVDVQIFDSCTITTTISDNTFNNGSSTLVSFSSDGASTFTGTVSNNTFSNTLMDTSVSIRSTDTSSMTATVTFNSFNTIIEGIFCYGSLSSTTTFTASNNQFENSNRGVSANVSEDAQLTMTANSNTFNGVNNFGIGIGGGFMSTDSCSITAEINNNTFDFFGISSTAIEVNTDGLMTSVTNVTASNNTFNVGFLGFELITEGESELNATLNDNDFLSLTQESVLVRSNAMSNVTVIADGNLIAEGLGFSASNLDSSNLTFTATNNVFQDLDTLVSSKGAIDLRGFGVAVTATANNNSFTNIPTGVGIVCLARNANTFIATINDNVFTDVLEVGVQCDSKQTSTLNPSLSGNTMTNVGSDGISIIANDGSNINAAINNNQISGPSADGVLVLNFSSGLLKASSISGNTINNLGAAASGMLLRNLATGTISASITNNNLTIHPANMFPNAALRADVFAGGSMCLTVTGNTENGGGNPGSTSYNLLENAGGTFTVNPPAGMAFDMANTFADPGLFLPSTAAFGTGPCP